MGRYLGAGALFGFSSLSFVETSPSGALSFVLSVSALLCLGLFNLRACNQSVNTRGGGSV